MGMCKWFLPLGTLGPEGYCRPCTRRFRRRPRFFGYYTNMMQQIKFIIELFIQTFKPSWHLAIIISFSTYFFLNPLETWYRYIGFQGLRVYWHCPFSCAIQTLDIAAILILSLIFYYWHNIYWKRLCQICGHFESVHQQSVFECLHSIF